MTTRNKNEKQGSERVKTYGFYVYGLALLVTVFFFVYRRFLGRSAGSWREYAAIAFGLCSLGLSSKFYVGGFREEKKSNPHYENLFALSVAALFFSSFSPKGWLFLFFIPPYLAYLAYDFIRTAKGALSGVMGGGGKGGGGQKSS